MMFKQLQLILLALQIVYAIANPIGSPEIIGTSNVNHVNNNVNNSHDYKFVTPETLSNAYAGNYELSATATSQSNPPFKPSFQLSVNEHNYVPLQNSNSEANVNPTNTNANSPPTFTNGSPVLMQYMPQMLQEGGVQYLQLIPTRPLIIPMTPYINAANAPTAPVYAANAPTVPVYAPSKLSFSHAHPQYAGRSPTVYANLPGPTAQPVFTSSLLNLQNKLQETFKTYATSFQPHRNSYRFNREVKTKATPSDLNLNMNEYIPLNPQALKGIYVRGRP